MPTFQELTFPVAYLSWQKILSQKIHFIVQKLWSKKFHSLHFHILHLKKSAFLQIEERKENIPALPFLGSPFFYCCYFLLSFPFSDFFFLRPERFRGRQRIDRTGFRGGNCRCGFFRRESSENAGNISLAL